MSYHQGIIFHCQRKRKFKCGLKRFERFFRSMGNGSTSASPYDTAWVSLIPAVDGTKGPQFPGSLQWLIENQLEDGSWGDPDFFSYSNNVLCTLMSIIALKTWNTGLQCVERGESFVRINLPRLEDEEYEMLCGFEIVFPTVLEDAKELGLDIPYDLPFFEKYRAAREKKLQKLPLQLLYSSPTTILYSLEGVRDIIDWEQVLQFQQDDGSLLASPASTACAYLHTGNKKCLQYLSSVVQGFDHAAPSQYPLEIFERLWVVDRLERLGIARHFQSEIRTCLDYVYKLFSRSSHGISWSSACNVMDLDDTAMAFRLLRLHGYDVSPDCLKSFRSAEGDWYTFAGEVNQGVTSTFNLYRAGQTCYPGESILMEGAEWARKFLVEKSSKEGFNDKWVIGKDIAGEVAFALQNPWYYTLPRLEHRSYLDQYGPDDIWISKVLYRMFSISNNTFLKLAKADFNVCQSKHQEDLQEILRWNEESGLKGLSFGRKVMVYCFYTGACCLPAAEHSMARRVWTQIALLSTLIDDFFDALSESYTDKNQFVAATRSWNPNLMKGTSREAQVLFEAMYRTVNDIVTEGSLLQGRDISYHIHDTMKRLVESHMTEAEWTHMNVQPSLEEYMSVAEWGVSMDAMMTTHFFLGEKISHEMVEGPYRKDLLHLANVIARMSNYMETYQRKLAAEKSITSSISKGSGLTQSGALEKLNQLIHQHMRKFSEEIHSPSTCQPVIPRSVRQLYFDLVRSFLFTYRIDDGRTSASLNSNQSIARILYESVSK
ncbi:hypothetical protein Mapa_001252 [Marchantia paleacea]|nr:hypothetical protein Mapa_001252 [Marchantia paleacea]